MRHLELPIIEWMHNGTFDFTTGEAKGAPACVNLATYPAKVEGGRLFVNLA